MPGQHGSRIPSPDWRKKAAMTSEMLEPTRTPRRAAKWSQIGSLMGQPRETVHVKMNAL